MLLFSEYDQSLKNISISQPIVDVDIEDTNSLIIRYPKFKRVTHLILSYDAQNLFLKQKKSLFKKFLLNLSLNSFFSSIIAILVS